MKYWRDDDDRVGAVIIKAPSASEAVSEFLACCAQNTRTQEATEIDLDNFGPAWVRRRGLSTTPAHG